MNCRPENRLKSYRGDFHTLRILLLSETRPCPVTVGKIDIRNQANEFVYSQVEAIIQEVPSSAECALALSRVAIDSTSFVDQRLCGAAWKETGGRAHAEILSSISDGRGFALTPTSNSRNFSARLCLLNF